MTENTDKIAPTLSSAIPKANGSAVKVNQNVILKFNEAVKAGSGNIVISDGKDSHSISITDKSQIKISGNTLTLNPTDNLLPNSTYSVKISASAIKDLAGNKFAGILNKTALSFNTVDTLSPQLDALTAKNLSAPMAVDKNIVLTFNETVKAGAGIFVISNGSDTRKIAITDNSQVTFDGKIVTLNPTKDLQGNGHYNVTFRNTVVKDLAGNKFAGISDKTALSFNTADNVAPQFDALTAKNLSAPMASDKNLVLIFNEAIQAGSGNIVISNGTDIRTISITDKTQVTVTGKTVTINPTVDLNFSSNYSIKLAAGTLKDLAGNSFAGNETSALLFTTVAKPIVIDVVKPVVPVVVPVVPVVIEIDKIAPTLTSSSPTDNGVNVLIGANLVLTFNETIKAGSGNIIISNGTDIRTISIADKTQITVTDKTVTINPTADLLAGSHYSVQFAAGVITDNAGNPFAGLTNATALNFTSAAAVIAPVVVPVVTIPVVTTIPELDLPLDPNDKTAPTLSSFTPNDNSVNVANGANIVLNFSEGIKAGTGNLVISGSSGDVRVIDIKDSTQVTISGQTLTLNPTNDLSGDHFYSVHLNAGVVKDLSNNNFAGINDDTTFNFRTAAVVLMGKAIDGELSGSTIFADTNGDGKWNAGEAKTTTDAKGNFTLTNGVGNLVGSGGKDMATGQNFDGYMTAPTSSSVITPLTTLLQEYIKTGQSVAEAQKSVATLIGIPANSNVDFRTYDHNAELVKSATAGVSTVTQDVATKLAAFSAQFINLIITAEKTIQGAAGGAAILSNGDVTAGLVKAFVAQAQTETKAVNDTNAHTLSGTTPKTFKLDLATNTTFIKDVVHNGVMEVNLHAENVAKNTGTTSPLAFDPTVLLNKMTKMSDDLVSVAQFSAASIQSVVTKGGNISDLMTGIAKASTFAQNDAGAALQKAASEFNPSDTTAGNVFKGALVNYVGDKATAGIEAKTGVTPFAGLDDKTVPYLPHVTPPVEATPVEKTPVVTPPVENNTGGSGGGSGGDSTPTATPNPTNTLISANGTDSTASAATSGVDTFNVTAGTYTHTISGFAAGDKLNFFANAILNVVPDSSNADLSQIITATDPVTGSTATITLTGITAAQDAGLFNVPSFATQFGANTIGTIAGTLVATASVDTFNIAAGQNVSISGFANGDKLVFFPNAVLNVVPDTNQTDGNQTITANDPATGLITTITLTGITAAQDAGVFNVPSFVTQFGAGSIA